MAGDTQTQVGTRALCRHGSFAALCVLFSRCHEAARHSLTGRMSMSYIFKGSLRGLLCAQCAEPLAGVTLRRYRPLERANVITHAVASPKDTFAPLSDDEVRAKGPRLLAEVVLGDAGEFEVALDKGYQGGAFEVDIYCGTVPKGPPKPKATPQFTITTLQPQWRELEAQRVAAWEYQVPQRFWCAVRGQLGAWVICGRVALCKDKRPLAGVRVRAFDCDWLQHDALGEAVTDASGHFRIDYTAAAFKKTIFPGLALEWVSGPDLYFHLDTLAGSPLLREPPARGRQSDRDNVGPCFCVELCVDTDVQVPPDPEPLAVFDSLGNYHFQTQIDSALGGTGRTADERAFYSTVRLNGVLPRKLSGQPLEYRFESRLTDAAGNALGPWVAIDPADPAQCGEVLMGRVEHFAPTPADPSHVDTTLVYVTPNAAPPGALRAELVGGWVRVPQQADVYGAVGNFVPNGNMLGANTQRLAASPTISVAGVEAGQSSTALGAPLSQNRYAALRMRVRQVGAPTSEVSAGECVHFAIDNTRYDGVAKGGSWMPHVLLGQLAAVSVDALQLRTNGCAGVHDDLEVVFTCAHPNLGEVSLTLSGPGGPYGFTLPPRSPGEHFGRATNAFSFATLADCAYIIDLSAPLLLTNGDNAPTPVQDRVAFCKRRR